MSEPLRFTSRGFAVYADFIDRYDAHVRVVESSFAPEPCVWIFVEGGQTGDNDVAAHLTLPMAIIVRDALDAWIEGAEKEEPAPIPDLPSLDFAKKAGHEGPHLPMRSSDE